MQVRRLIEVLSVLPQDAQVVVEKESSNLHTVTGVTCGFDDQQKSRVRLMTHKKSTNR